MCADQVLPVVIYWHMHQPDYRDLRNGEYQLPWTYLHAIKDYVDMVAHLEAVPAAKAVVNFTPVLLEQIEDYRQQMHGYLEQGSALRDPLLAALMEPALPTSLDIRLSLIKECLRANRHRLIDHFPPFKRLALMADNFIKHPDMLIYVEDQYLVDLLMWYHLAWLGETIRRSDRRTQTLMDKGTGFTNHDRRSLLTIMSDSINDVVERYRKLAENGQVELSVTPYAHPIMPLLLDIESARDAMPDVLLPQLRNYPGGEERARWHIEQGLKVFERYFQFRPAGCWPAEGSVSDATLKLLAEYDFKWAATGEGVLHNSLRKSKLKLGERGCIHRPYEVDNTDMACFFRDDGLSDLIGFTYSDWHADDAAANLIHHLENIADSCADQTDRVVTIILDGENAWEHYPANGFYFLRAMYRRLSEHPRLQLTTFSECLAQGKPQTRLKTLTAGSWVYGSFSTWIGDPDKNRGWDMLGDAKQVYDRVMAEGRLSGAAQARAELQLALCEGSDWFWWFGDYNPANTVSDFERLFRLNLSNLYLCLGEEPPGYLSHVMSHGSGMPAMGGTMRPGRETVE